MRREEGAPFAVYQVHREKRFPATVVEAVALGMAVARDKLVVAMSELHGDIWMAEM